MKRLWLIALIILSAGFAKAQVEKGTNFVGGSLLLTTSQVKGGEGNPNAHFFSTTLRYGHFVSDDLAIGLQMEYQSNLSSSFSNRSGIGVWSEKI